MRRKIKPYSIPQMVLRDYFLSYYQYNLGYFLDYLNTE